MKVALINPQTETDTMREGYGYHENLGLGLIGANLKSRGHETFIFDLRVHKLNENQVSELIIKNRIKLIGISVNYSTLPSALKIAQIIKLKINDCIIALGGEHATYLDKEILKEYSAVDFIVRGEGEITFLELADRIENKDSLYSIEGISYMNLISKKFIRTPNRKSIENLDVLPFASRDVANYALNNDIPIEIGILAQRGCPFHCSFCNAYKFLSNEESILHTRTRTPLNVINEIEMLVPLFEKDQNLILRFYDATFITRSIQNRKWINEFCMLLEERKIKIPFDAFIRSDSFNFNEDKDLIYRLKNVGFIGTYVGLEAGDDNTLEIYNKGVECVNSFQTMMNLKKLEIDGATNGVICFHQNVSLEEISNSIKFLKNLGFCTSWNIASKAETLPGIALEKEMKLYPRKTVWDVENYNFSNSKISFFYEAIKKLKTKYYISQYEDYIIRRLREAIKLKQFYNDKKSHELDLLKSSLEEDISLIQTITYKFFLSLIERIQKNEITELEKLDLEVRHYADKIMPNLLNLSDKYSILIPTHKTNNFKIEMAV